MSSSSRSLSITSSTTGTLIPETPRHALSVRSILSVRSPDPRQPHRSRRLFRWHPSRRTSTYESVVRERSGRAPLSYGARRRKNVTGPVSRRSSHFPACRTVMFRRRQARNQHLLELVQSTAGPGHPRRRYGVGDELPRSPFPASFQFLTEAIARPVGVYCPQVFVVICASHATRRLRSSV